MSFQLDGESVGPTAPLMSYPTTLGGYFGGKWREAFWNDPLVAAGRIYSLSTAGETQYSTDEITGEQTLVAPAARMLSFDEASTRLKERGVPLAVPEAGINEAALDILIERRQNELARQTAIAASPIGLRSVAGFGVALAANLVDPLNIAAAFVPIIGLARYTALLGAASGAAGRAGVRLGVGALEGGIGTAALEPLIYGANRMEQADYTMVDSLLNIALGTALGGGMHAVGGAIGDRLTAAGAETRMHALKGAIGQAADGRKVDDTVLGSDTGTGFWYTPAKTLTSEHRAIETRFGEEIADFEKARARYEAIPESEGGKVISTDIARELSSDYLGDRTVSKAVHEPASAFVKRLYAAKLAETLKEGQRPIVLFTAGGTGAGKTSAIAEIPKLHRAKREAHIVYDTNMNTYESAVGKIRQALAANHHVGIVLVGRDPVEALRLGAIARAIRQEKKFGSGRTVPLEEHLSTHVGSMDVVERLADEFTGDSRVKFRGVDNYHGKGNAREVRLAEVLKNRYDSDVLRPLLRAALEDARAQGLSDALYRGFADESAGPGRAFRLRGVDERSRRGDGRVSEQTSQEVLAGAQRQATPEAVAVADVPAARAADERLTQAPKGEALKQAEAEVERVTARYTGLRQNLKNAGFDEVQLAKSDEFMASFEAAVKDADNVGKAMRAAAVCGLRA